MPNLIIIDVEGYEFAVIEGADRTLQSPGLEAIIVELNGSGLRYGYNNRDGYKKLRDYGFTAAKYYPFDRKLEPADESNKFSQNTLFVRSHSVVEAKCHEAASFNIFGRHI